MFLTIYLSLRKLIVNLKSAILFVSSLTLIACGGGGGPSGSTDLILGGNWYVLDTVDETACGGTIEFVDFTLTVTQTDSTISISNPAIGLNATAGVNGNTVTWSGSYSEPPGTVTTNLEMTIDSSGTSATGTSNWTYSEGGFSCSGTSTFTAACESGDCYSENAEMLAGVSSTNGQLKNTNSVDIYSITIPSTGNYTISLSNYAPNDFDLFLRNSNQQVIDSSVLDDPVETIFLTANQGELYYIDVYSFFGSGNYTLTVDLN